MFKKLFCSSIFLLLTSFVFAQSKLDTIHWRPDYKLKWEDFQAHPDNNSPDIANSNTSFSYRYQTATTGNTFVVVAYFNKNKSWVQRDKMNSNTLIHEQGHFDIREIYAKKLSQILNNHLNMEQNALRIIARQLCDSVASEQAKFDNQYDSETLHGADHFKQREWNEKIKLILMDNSR